MDGLGWDKVAGGVFEISRLGIGIALIRFSGLLLFRLVMPALKFEAPRILEDITVIIAYCAWGLIRLRYAGLDLSHIVATSAVMTAIVAFAMQDTLGNILGGLAIHLDHSVEIGDWVVADGISGRVIDIRWRYTKIATRNGEKVVVPNSVLMKNKFSVVGIYGGKTNAWRRWVWFNVGLDHGPGRVIEVVEQVVREAKIPHVAKDPAPSAVVMDFGAGYVRYALRYWLTDPQFDDPTDSEMRVHIFAALERSGMTLAMPEEVRHVVNEDERRERQLAAKEMRHRLSALAHVDVLSSLSQEELKILATHLIHAPFVRGDVITRQGAMADCLYVLVSGDAEIWLESDDDDRRLMSTLHAGSVFGEMGLLTGEPRRATVVAKTDVDCYRLDKAGLGAVMEARPGMAEDIARILAVRELERERVRLSLDESAHAPRREHHRETFLNRIRTFFRLA